MPQTARFQQSAVPRANDLRPISELLLLFFHRIAQRRIRRSFRALRVAHWDRAAGHHDAALIVALNHPSWWDPLVGFVLSRRLFPGRHFYAPMEEKALRRYRIFRRLGMFPVATQSPRGAAQFLRAGATVLEQGHILAVTPQGRFTDVRARPVVFQPGLAALLHRRAAQGKATMVLPLALEYTFWDQRPPEVLVNCGDPLCFAGHTQGPRQTQQEIHAALEKAMERAQDELAALAQRRDSAEFALFLEGRRGSAGVYGLYERLLSVLRGSRSAGDHASATDADTGHTVLRNP